MADVDLDVWGKLSQGPPPRAHPLVFHLIDTGHVLERLWSGVFKPGLSSWLACCLGLEEEATRRWLCFWGSLHDIGKATPAFQGKAKNLCPELFQRLCDRGYRFRGADSATGHGILTTRILKDLHCRDGVWSNLPSDLAKTVATVLGGHHGMFPSLGIGLVYELGNCDGRWDACRQGIVRTLERYWCMGGLPAPKSGAGHQPLCMVLAGMVTVADWIASNEDFFGPDGNTTDLAEYGERSRHKAEKALDRLAWHRWNPPSEPAKVAVLFPAIHVLRPLQETAEKLTAALDSPGLVIIEAPTGEGKTEAAMLLADHWAATLAQRGCYFALPTQATSNQMFGRVRAFLSTRYPHSQVNMLLLHGHASLSAEFEELRQNAERLFSPDCIGQDDSAGENDPTVLAAEWFTYRKRGLLAPFGVGTIDQALLSVLQTKHVFVRLFGLAHKTVILDEVHAYDTYMTTLIERLLEWLASLGSSVVLLSATLPNSRRRQLIEAFRRGLGVPGEIILSQTYPRITWTTKTGFGECHIATSPPSAKEIQVQHVNGQLPPEAGGCFELCEKLRTALSAGGCAAVICNSVNRAQDVYKALKRHFTLDELDLLHARYLFKDRQEREERCLRRFGKPDDNGVHRPYRAVLVSTQIIEQSLDLDFDLMVTDVAPVDLLLQRAGRLHRHPRDRRPSELQRPSLWICWPEEGEGGAPVFDPGTKAVYDPHVLLRTWLAIRDRTAVRIPDDVSPLIEAVYAERNCPGDIPPALQGEWENTFRDHQRDAEAQRLNAEDRWLRTPLYHGPLWQMIPNTLEEESPELHTAHQALTRLGGPSVDVVCLDESLGSMTTRTPSGADAKELLMRSVRVSHGGLVRALLALKQPAAWRQSTLLRNYRPIIFDGNQSAQVDKYTMRIDPELGLCINTSGQEAVDGTIQFQSR